jgi:hypothetical protein
MVSEQQRNILMQLTLQGAYLEFFPDLRLTVERRLHDALNGVRGGVRGATVSLRKPVGARSAGRWQCVVRLRLRLRSSIVVKATSPLPSQAIEGATDLLRRAVNRDPAPPRKDGRSRPDVDVLPQWGGRSVARSTATFRSRRHHP